MVRVIKVHGLPLCGASLHSKQMPSTELLCSFPVLLFDRCGFFYVSECLLLLSPGSTLISICFLLLELGLPLFSSNFSLLILV